MKVCRACGEIKPLAAYYKKKRRSGSYGTLPDCKPCHCAMLRKKYVKQPKRVSDITPLRPWLHEPYRKDAVLEAARKLRAPFILGEIVRASGLPTPIVHRVLGRLVKQGVLVRFKIKVPFPTVTGARNKGLQPVRWVPGGRQRVVWAYQWPEAE